MCVTLSKRNNRRRKIKTSKSKSLVYLLGQQFMEKVVTSKQLRLAVETEEERRTRLEAFLKS